MRYFASSLPSSSSPSVMVRQPMPPRDWFARFPDVLDKYDAMVRLNAAIVEHADSSRIARHNAENADFEYGESIKEALRAGTDPSAVSNKRDSYLQQASAHERLSQEAQTKATAHGHVLGEALAAVAKEVAADAEQRITNALEEVERIERTKASYLASIAHSWPIRLSMSSLHYTGGELHAHYPSAPQDAREELSNLNAEEAHIEDRRERDAAAAQRQSAYLGA
ncbi:hypothetical protein ACQCSU_08125 [Pseudarthrobacter sp. O4]|uniref:hypothetical protein n=1 Tax=Pseudarthrobacter sp. O4 TaxID=3418417 RepID=UPI003CFAAD85